MLPRTPSILFVHDARSRACDGLVQRLRALVEEEVAVAVSAQSAAEAVRESRSWEGGIRIAFVCLDLQPAPRAGSRIAEFAIARGIPVVLVTRSARWIPQGSTLEGAPWIPPDATDEQIARAIEAAIDVAGEITMDGAADDVGDRVSIGF